MRNTQGTACRRCDNKVCRPFSCMCADVEFLVTFTSLFVCLFVFLPTCSYAPWQKWFRDTLFEPHLKSHQLLHSTFHGKNQMVRKSHRMWLHSTIWRWTQMREFHLLLQELRLVNSCSMDTHTTSRRFLFWKVLASFVELHPLWSTQSWTHCTTAH